MEVIGEVAAIMAVDIIVLVGGIVEVVVAG
jgi:hypothetical protein